MSPEEKASLLEVIKREGLIEASEPFRLSSGALSSHYVDLRRALADGEHLKLAALVLIDHLLTHHHLDPGAIDAIGGLTMGADPIAHAVSVLSGCSWFSVRKEPKSHGTRNLIEGKPLGPADRVVLVEDTLSTGESMLKAAAVVRASGAEILCAVALLDRGSKGAARMAGENIAYSSVFTYEDLGIAPL